MGLVIVLICIIMIAAFRIPYGVPAQKKYFKEVTVGLIVCSTIIVALIVTVSYVSMIKMQMTKAILSQEASSINLYIEKAKVGNSSTFFPEGSLTDMKYKNYQICLAKMITSFKNMMESYNKMVVSKSILKKSFFWNWMIFVPTHMKILNFSDYIR